MSLCRCSSVEGHLRSLYRAVHFRRALRIFPLLVFFTKALLCSMLYCAPAGTELHGTYAGMAARSDAHRAAQRERKDTVTEIEAPAER